MIKVLGILWVTELRLEGCLHPVDIIPVDPFEPDVRLRSVSRWRIPVIVTAIAVNNRSSREPIAADASEAPITRGPVVRRRSTGRCGGGGGR